MFSLCNQAFSLGTPPSSPQTKQKSGDLKEGVLSFFFMLSMINSFGSFFFWVFMFFSSIFVSDWAFLVLVELDLNAAAFRTNSPPSSRSSSSAKPRLHHATEPRSFRLFIYTQDCVIIYTVNIKSSINANGREWLCSDGGEKKQRLLIYEEASIVHKLSAV